MPKTRIINRDSMHWVGNGFPVRSVFGYNDLGQELSPFLLMDYAAPYRFEPGMERRGVGAHPHRGFETVTIAYQGEIEHRDSGGGGGVIGPGDVQWMTAAGGLIHEEFHSAAFTASGGMFEMIQLWINLPARHKNEPPAYQTLLKKDIPIVEIGSGVKLRIIAGNFNDISGPARTFTPINLWELSFESGNSVELSVPATHTRALFVMEGSLSVDGQPAKIFDLAIPEKGAETIALSALSRARVLLMSGEPLGEPVVGHGPFVMNSQAEIKQAFNDFQLGKMGTLE